MIGYVMAIRDTYHSLDTVSDVLKLNLVNMN